MFKSALNSKSAIQFVKKKKSCMGSFDWLLSFKGTIYM